MFWGAMLVIVSATGQISQVGPTATEFCRSARDYWRANGVVAECVQVEVGKLLIGECAAWESIVRDREQQYQRAVTHGDPLIPADAHWASLGRARAHLATCGAS